MNHTDVASRAGRRCEDDTARPVAGAGPMTLEPQHSMGMSSVTEAPRWSEATSAARRVPALAAGRPAELALVSADATQLRFEGRRPMLAPLLLSPLLTCLGSLPWLSPEPIGGVRLAVSGLF